MATGGIFCLLSWGLCSTEKPTPNSLLNLEFSDHMQESNLPHFPSHLGGSVF